MSGINFNPAPATNFGDSFSVQSDGYVQGVALDDPAVRYQLEQGVLDAAAAQPIWGGFGVLLNTASAAADALGADVKLATTAAISGFSVFNQAGGMINWPQSRVPTAQPGQSVNFYRFGTRARIPLQTTAVIAAALQAAGIAPQLYWDTVALQLTNASNGNTVALPTTVTIYDVEVGNSKVVNWASSQANWNGAGSVVVLII